MLIRLKYKFQQCKIKTNIYLCTIIFLLWYFKSNTQMTFRERKGNYESTDINYIHLENNLITRNSKDSSIHEKLYSFSKEYVKKFADQPIISKNYVDNLDDAASFNLTTIETMMKKIILFAHTPKYICNKLANFGGKLYKTHHGCVIDGYKPVCMDLHVHPNPKDCLALSFGVGYELSFDNAFGKYGCKVLSFDFSLHNWTNNVYKPHQHYLNIMLSDEISNHKLVKLLSPKGEFVANQKTSVHTLYSISRVLDLLNKNIDYLKIDIENNEWNVFTQIFNSEKGMKILENVNQIILEIHLSILSKVNQNLDKNFEELLKIIKVFHNLNEAGFYVTQYMNNEQTRDYVRVGNLTSQQYLEVLFVKRAK